MEFSKLPSQAFIRQHLDYDPETGIFRWRSRGGVRQSWNTRWAGKIAGQISDNGYRVIGLGYKQHRAHRLAWVYVHGDVLDERTEVDHKNRQRDENWIENLRPASKGQNGANSIGKSRSGLPKGVERNKARFTARLMIDGVRKCLGTYDTPEEAQCVYIAALEAGRGEFARAA